MSGAPARAIIGLPVPEHDPEKFSEKIMLQEES